MAEVSSSTTRSQKAATRLLADEQANKEACNRFALLSAAELDGEFAFFQWNE